ncbi:MAG: NAD(P)-dependent glycerol-3-phosphate dehydrogenase [Dehalococcoidia bacterium]|nr:NAD(P)-dependent glycerol-3-phosphate dehydrogenase [Dehalococcoidia bacterium]MDW8120480.1 NAD(P)H-dependent glycerol-3-phosphate dehydrogenase [Chloroflexota bacterium]
MAKIGVVGTTTWGTTLAVLLARRGHTVTLLALNAEEVQALTRARHHPRLPTFPFPPTLHLTPDPWEVAQNAQMVVLAVPSPTMRENARRLAPALEGDTIVLHGSKGLEPGTALRMSEVLAQELPAHRGRVAVLAGPNLAGEIARGLPASTVVASADAEVARWVQEAFHSPTFRVYTSRDVVGVELGGVLKNTFALGAGMCDGLGLGTNAKSALITRALAEMIRLGVAAGAEPWTFAGLAGIGDLMATCWSTLSRNRQVGERLGQGYPLQEVMRDLGQVAEGVHTVAEVMRLAERYQVEMPIARMIYRVLFEGVPVAEAMEALLHRPPEAEWPHGWSTSTA